MKTFKQILEEISQLTEATKRFGDLADELSKGDLSSFGKDGKKSPGGLMRASSQAHLASIRNDPNPKHPHVKEFLNNHFSNPAHPDHATHMSDHKGTTLKGAERQPHEMRGFKKSQEGAKSEEPAKVEPKVDHTAEHSKAHDDAKARAAATAAKLAPTPVVKVKKTATSTTLNKATETSGFSGMKNGVKYENGKKA